MPDTEYPGWLINECVGLVVAGGENPTLAHRVARAVLGAIKATGCKIVGPQPTQAMLDVEDNDGYQPWSSTSHYFSTKELADEYGREVWQAMIIAAPFAPPERPEP